MPFTSTCMAEVLSISSPAVRSTAASRVLGSAGDEQAARRTRRHLEDLERANYTESSAAHGGVWHAGALGNPETVVDDGGDAKLGGAAPNDDAGEMPQLLTRTSKRTLMRYSLCSRVEAEEADDECPGAPALPSQPQRMARRSRPSPSSLLSSQQHQSHRLTPPLAEPESSPPLNADLPLRLRRPVQTPSDRYMYSLRRVRELQVWTVQVDVL